MTGGNNLDFDILLKAIKGAAADYDLLSYDDNMTLWLLHASVEMVIL